ncbi:MAG: efflux RND transporter periplasmic adaptor subunit [Phycisphaerae bacterium]
METGNGGGRTGGMVRLIKRVLRIGWKLALVAAIAAFVLYRLRYAPLSVESHVAATGPIASEVMGTGTLEARVLATISPKISGLVTQVLVDQGDRIAKGQLLATLYDGDLRQQVEMAKADLAATEAGVDRSASEITSAEATAVLARAEIGRVTSLHQSGAATAYELDVATERHDVAESGLKRAQLAKVEIERQVLKAEETLRFYQERLADSQILSPFDGLVVRRSREPGDIIVPGSEILQIISTEQMWVSAWVDETAMASLSPGQPARVVFRSEPDRSYNGTVTRLAPLADRETREFLVDVTVKDLPKTWAVGQRAEVYIQTAKKDQALLAPQAAIVWRKDKSGLFVSNAGRAEWRSVTLGLRGEDSVEVTQGLTAGEVVVWLHDPKNGSLTEGRAVAPASVP